MRWILLLVLLLYCVASLGQECGGTERWAVKDGTDDARSQVDIAHIAPTTIQDLVRIKQPSIPDDNVTRVIPDETRVVRVTAHLIQWKQEDDADYHLVLTDDTLRFTPGHGRPT